MSDEIHPLARALLGNSDGEPDRNVACAVCGAPTLCPGFIVNSVKIWNQHAKTPADIIRPSEIGVACDGACTTELFRRKHEQYQNDNATTLAFLGMLHAGKYNAESLAWLRTHGQAKAVERLLAKEGTRGA